MPVQFTFTDKATNETVLLDDIDREMCEETGHPYSEKRYCSWFQLITDIGCNSKLHNAAGQVDKDKLLTAIAEDVPERDKDIVMKYLCDKYIFSAWWQSR